MRYWHDEFDPLEDCLSGRKDIVFMKFGGKARKRRYWVGQIVSFALLIGALAHLPALPHLSHSFGADGISASAIIEADNHGHSHDLDDQDGGEANVADTHNVIDHFHDVPGVSPAYRYDLQKDYGQWQPGKARTCRHGPKCGIERPPRA
jgi:hypothetical protein